MNNISDILFEAIDTIVNQRIKEISFDITVFGTVTDVNQDTGAYQIKTLTAEFWAHPQNEQTYNINDRVYVLIPQGNYDNTKIILGTTEAETSETQAYTNPFNNLVAAYEVNVTNTMSATLGVTNSMRCVIPQFSADYPVAQKFKDTFGLSQLGISTTVESFGYNGSKYGLMLIINNDTEGKLLESYLLAQQILLDNFSNLENNKTLTNNYLTLIDKGYVDTIPNFSVQSGYEDQVEELINVLENYIYYYDSSQFIGDIYNFEDGYLQEQCYNLTLPPNTIITHFDIIPYLTCPEGYVKTATDKIEFSDIKIMLGYDKTICADGDVSIYLDPTQSTDYGVDFQDNKKNLYASIVASMPNDDSGKLFIVPMPQSNIQMAEYYILDPFTEYSGKRKYYIKSEEGYELDNSVNSSNYIAATKYIKIKQFAFTPHWYQYEVGAPDDGYGGLYWQEIDSTAGLWKLTDLTLDTGKPMEEYKVVIVLQLMTETSEYYKISYGSSTISFTNKSLQSDLSSVTESSYLSIGCINDEHDGYFNVYGYDDKQIQTLKTQPGLQVNYLNSFSWEDSDIVKWYFPKINTMIAPVFSTTALQKFLPGEQNLYTDNKGVNKVAATATFDPTLTYYEKITNNGSTTYQIKDFLGKITSTYVIDSETQRYCLIKQKEKKFYLISDRDEDLLSYEEIQSMDAFYSINQTYASTNAFYYDDDYYFIIQKTGSEGRRQVYGIKSTYSPSATTNTIECEVIKDTFASKIQKTIYFGYYVTSGTGFSLNLKTDRNILGHEANYPLNITTIEVQLQDDKNNVIPVENWLTEPEKLKVEWYAGATQKDLDKNYLPAISIDKNIITLTRTVNIVAIFSVLQVTLSQFSVEGLGNIDLVQYLPIGYTGASQATNFQGAQRVIYDNTGATPQFDNSFYALYKSDFSRFDNSEGYWKVICYDEAGNWIQGTPPLTLKKNNTTNESSLSPASIMPSGIIRAAVHYFTSKTATYSSFTMPIFVTRNSFMGSLTNNWDGKQVIDSDNNIIFSNLIGAGTKDQENKFTGVLMGAVGKEFKTAKTGLYGYSAGNLRYKLDQDGNFYVGNGSDNRINFNGGTLEIDVKNFNLNSNYVKLSSTNNANLHLGDSTNYFSFNTQTKKMSIALGTNGNKIDFSGSELIIETNKLKINATNIKINSTEGSVHFGSDTKYLKYNTTDGLSISLGSDAHQLTYTNTNGLIIKAKSFDFVDSKEETRLSSTEGIVAKKGVIGGWTLTDKALYTKASNGKDGNGNGFLAGTTVGTNPVFYAGYSKNTEKNLGGNGYEWPTYKENWVTNGITKCMITQEGEFYAWGGISMGGGNFGYDASKNRIRMNGNIELENSNKKTGIYIGDYGGNAAFGSTMYTATDAYCICFKDRTYPKNRQLSIAAVNLTGLSTFDSAITHMHRAEEGGTLYILCGSKGTDPYGSEIYLRAGKLTQATSRSSIIAIVGTSSSSGTTPYISLSTPESLELDTNKAFIHMAEEDIYIQANSGKGVVYIYGDFSYDKASSDRRLKYGIESFPPQYDELFDKLKPVRYKYHHDDIEQYHTGFIAQDIEQSLSEVGLSTLDLGAIFKTRSLLAKTIGEEEVWSMYRDELVSLNTWQIQKLKARVAALEQEIKELKQ